MEGYPRRALWADVARSLGGLALVGLPLITLDLASWLRWVLIAVALLFAWFGLATARRLGFRVGYDDESLWVTNARHKFRWADLSGITMNYYSTSRERKRGPEQGWMDLKLRFGRRTVHFDSRVANFNGVTECALLTARRLGLSIEGRTLANIQALGIQLPEPPETEGWLDGERDDPAGRKETR